jgi:brefeldin A-inhibited guanine nucleotide-exchange protein
MQKEIEVLLNEIFLPILEMRNSTVKQKTTVLSMVLRLCQDPQALVEVYLNYDCDREALENIYERLMNIISKIGSAHNLPSAKGSDSPVSARRSSTHVAQSPSVVPPSLTTSALGSTAGSEASATPAAVISAEAKLKKQGLECLVAVLRSLVAWGTTPGKGPADASADAVQLQSRGSEDGNTGEGLSVDTKVDRLSPALVSEPSRGSTSSLADDPGRFESAKQKKTTLLEGIKKFNFKPKRVSSDIGFQQLQAPPSNPLVLDRESNS